MSTDVVVHPKGRTVRMGAMVVVVVIVGWEGHRHMSPLSPHACII